MIDWFLVAIMAAIVIVTFVGMAANVADKQDIAAGSIFFILVVAGGYMLMKYYGGP